LQKVYVRLGRNADAEKMNAGLLCVARAGFWKHYLT
jgi:hypothetical protein